MPPPIPIAFGITDLDVGGAEKMMVALVTGLDRRVWSPAVVSLQPPGPLGHSLEEVGIPLDSLGIRGPSDAPRALWRWRQILQRQQPRILQTFLVHANVLGRVAGRWAGVPRIVSGVRVADRRPRMIHRLDHWTASFADMHLCVSEGVRDYALTKMKLPVGKLRVISNGIEPEPAGPRVDIRKAIGLSDDGVSFLLFVGRLDPQKGLFDLLTALAALRQKGSCEKLRVVILGEGPLKGELQSMADRLNISEVIHWMGWQPNAIEWMRGADGLVLPSHWEGMPNVVLEAMSVGCPVIATAVEGSRELIESGKTGWLVPPHEPVRLAEAIVHWISDPNRQEMGRRGAAAIREKHSIRAMIAAYEESYRELLQSDHR